METSEFLHLYRKVNALLAMVGGIFQRNGNTPSLVQDAAPTEEEPELIVA
jgi:hypothetical protein